MSEDRSIYGEPGVVERFDFTGENLEGVHIHGGFFEPDFSDADLRNADITNAEIECGFFNGANLQGATFKDVNLMFVEFIGADLEMADFSYPDPEETEYETRDRYDERIRENHKDFVERWEPTEHEMELAEQRGYKVHHTRNKEAEETRPMRDIHDCDFHDAILKSTNFSNTYLNDVGFTDSNLWNSNFERALLTDGCDFSGARMVGVSFVDAEIQHGDLSETDLRNADLTRISCRSTDFTDSLMKNADLTNANLSQANLSNADLSGADLTGASLDGANLSNVDLSGADLTGASLNDANLTDANLNRAKLEDTVLDGSNLTNVDFEYASLLRTNLFGANLTDIKPHGATFTDVQFNEDTQVRSKEQREKERQIWHLNWLLPPERCGYDPLRGTDSATTTPIQWAKAADTYQSLEKVARDNALDKLQSKMFVLKRDMQWMRYWESKGKLRALLTFDWWFTGVSRMTFKYGESLRYISFWAFAIVFIYTGLYAELDLIIDSNGEYISDWSDSLYFSTLTFTTLGLGDFQPAPTSEIARLLVTSQAALGAILIAIFVFVLGRRAAR